MDVLLDMAVLACVAGVGYAAGWWNRRHLAYETHLDELVEIKVVHS
jgi:hypothetical protein